MSVSSACKRGRTPPSRSGDAHEYCTSGPRPGITHLIVSGEQLRRALLDLQAIFKEAERRGCDVRALGKDPYGHRAGVAVAIRDHAYTIEISEQTDRVPLTDSEVAAGREQEKKPFRFR